MTRWRFVPLIVLLAFVAAVAWRLSHPPDTAIRSKMAGKPVPGVRASARDPDQAGPCLGRPRHRAAAPGQHLRQLVRAVHRRGAVADRRCSDEA